MDNTLRQTSSHSMPSALVNQTLSIIGAPLGFGAGKAGVDLGPDTMRAARLLKKLTALGYTVNDEGNLPIKAPVNKALPGENPRYLKEMLLASQLLADKVYQVLDQGSFPIVLGGDHSIAIGSQSGVTSYFHKKKETLGLIWFDAHADMNTPETSPSGNIHGMPLSALLGHGAPELVNLQGFSPKFDPRYCAHIGARDLDAGEKALIRELGIRFFTMSEIDERGMNVCIQEAIAIASKASAGYSVTFDVDSIDPFDAPGSGTLVRGGLTYREAHLAMEKIAKAGGMRSLEMVEVNPILDTNNRTAELAVELILSALGKTIL
ncbi:MAG: arginase [Pseudomonadota bacterium]